MESKTMEMAKVVEPRVDVRGDDQRVHTVLLGGRLYTQQVYPADSFGGIGTTPIQASWSISTPSDTTVIDPMILLRCYVEIKAEGADFQLGTNDGPRQFPLATIMDNINCQINGMALTDNITDKLHATLCYGNDRAERSKSWSMTPAMPDQYQQLSDWVTYGSGKNPLADYGENGAEDPRGGFPYVSIDARTKRYVFTEPIFLSPFYNGLGEQAEGFIGINEINLAIRWSSNLTKIWSHSSAGLAITNITVNFYRAPELLFTFITPNINQPLPAFQTSHYVKPVQYIKHIEPLAINQLTTARSDSLKLTHVPRRMMIFSRRQRDYTDFKTADAFGGIERLSVQWGNQTGLFANASQQDLYEMSRRNGLNMSWPQFSKYRGSVVCIEFGTQLGLSEVEAPGVSGVFTLSVEADVRNLSGENDYKSDLYLVLFYEGSVVISKNSASANIGILTPEEVLRSSQAQQIDYHSFRDLHGGGFWQNLKKFANKVSTGVLKGVEVAENILPVASQLYPPIAGIQSGLSTVRGVAEVAKKATGGGRPVGGRLRRLDM